jgi:hypothetical protein
MNMVIIGLTFYLSVFVFPAITMLILELRRKDRNNFMVAVYNIFLSLWLFGFMIAFFSAH